MRTLRRADGLILASLLAALCALGAPVPAAAQGAPDITTGEEGVIQELELADGSVFHGRIVEVADTVGFVLISGVEMSIPRDRIVRVSQAHGTVRDGKYWRPDPNRTRLFFGTTARSLPAGGGYLSVFELVMPFVTLGLTDHLTVSGGTPLVFGADEGDRPVWFAPKLRVWGNGRTDVALGALAFTSVAARETAGILYGVMTHGSADDAVTVGVGYGWVDGDLADNPAVMFGAETRVTSSVKLMTENYVIPGGDVLIAFGPRFFGERLSADVGLLLPVVDGSIDIALPLVNFVWNW